MVCSALKILLILFLLTAQPVYSWAASPLEPAAAGTPSPPLSVDGFKRTVDYWNELEKLAQEVQSTVAILDHQATLSFPDNDSAHVAYISGKLAEKYPGAKYDGKNGSVPLPDHLMASFAQDLKVTRITDVFTLGGKRSRKTYYMAERKFECISGFNSIAGVVNKEKGTDSEFTRVSFRDFQMAVEKLFASDPDAREAGSSVVAVLNDAYLLSARVQGMRMDTFAEKFLVNEDTYDFVLKNAQTGYRERHPSGSSTGNPSGRAPNVVRSPLSSSEGTPGELGAFWAGLFLVVLAIFTLLFYGVRWFLQELKYSSSVETRVQRSRQKSQEKSDKSKEKSPDVVPAMIGVGAVAPEVERSVHLSPLPPRGEGSGDAVGSAVAKVAWGEVTDSLGETVASAVEKRVIMAVDQLLAGMAGKGVPAPVASPPVTGKGAAVAGVPECVHCGKKMRVGTVTRGGNVGRKFWVCSGYPSCRNLLPFSPPSPAAEH